MRYIATYGTLVVKMVLDEEVLYYRSDIMNAWYIGSVMMYDSIRGNRCIEFSECYISKVLYRFIVLIAH